MYLSVLFALVSTASLTFAIPTLPRSLSEPATHGLLARSTTETANPAAITGLTCTSPGTKLVDHDINVALLSICVSIAGTIEQCQGNPITTTGESGTAKFTLTAQSGTIDITKGRWEGCVKAARAVCGDSPFTATCIGGAEANSANVDFELAAA